MTFLRTAALAATLGTAVATTAQAGEITIATVTNGHMLEMQKLTPEFRRQHPDITINWVTLDENTLRSRVTSDIENDAGEFDVLTIGMYEAPIWGSRGWLQPLDFSASYNVGDILPAIRNGLSYDGELYGAPFYGESSMIMYRRDLVARTGLRLEDNPSWETVRNVAAAIHDPDNGVYGICLRGRPGWGDNMAFLTTMANSYGAQWFNLDWTPAIDTPEWRTAVNFYVDLLQNYGPPGSENNSFNEILSLYQAGRCGMWIDATIAASFVTDPANSEVADQVSFAQAPQGVTTKGANWLWAWSLAIPASASRVEDATTFIEWATSRQYIELVGETKGWGVVPTGTRNSTYQDPRFQRAATFEEAELAAILSADPNDSTLNPSPYTGVQFAAIPEFQAIGTMMGEMMTKALTGELTVEEALATAQGLADEQMREAGYY